MTVKITVVLRENIKAQPMFDWHVTVQVRKYLIFWSKKKYFNETEDALEFVGKLEKQKGPTSIIYKGKTVRHYV